MGSFLPDGVALLLDGVVPPRWSRFAPRWGRSSRMESLSLLGGVALLPDGFALLLVGLKLLGKVEVSHGSIFLQKVRRSEF